MRIEIDKHSNLNSPIHRLDPRAKIVSLISFIFILVSTPRGEYMRFPLYFSPLLALMILSRVPPGFIFKRSLFLLPPMLLAGITLPFLTEGEIIASYHLGFLGLNVSIEGIQLFLDILAKSWFSILSVILLTSTTPFPDLLKGFEGLKVPKIMVLTISFMCRYIIVLVDEIMRMKRAWDLRSCGGNSRRHIKTAGDMIGSLFIRSYERAERIYYAMLSRGYSGSIKTLKDFRIQPLDVGFAVSFITLAVIVRFI